MFPQDYWIKGLMISDLNHQLKMP